MDPEPLVRSFADGHLDRMLDSAGIFHRVAGDLDLGVEPQNVAALRRDSTPRNPESQPLHCARRASRTSDWRRRASRKTARTRHCPRNCSDRPESRRVRSFAAPGGWTARSRASKAAYFPTARAAFRRCIDRRIVERPHHHVHRFGQQRVRIGAQLPVAQMGGGKQHAVAALFRPLIVFEAFIADPFALRLTR